MSNDRVITMRTLGHMGRWGNQIFQYSFLRIYSKQHGCRLEVIPWAGEELCGFRDSRISCRLPEYRERPIGEGRYMLRHAPPDGDEAVNHNWVGYAQFHTSWYAPHKEFIRSLFTPAEEISLQLEPAVGKLRSVGKTVVGIHVRRADYGRILYPRIPIEWYVQWLHEHWDTLEDPVLFYASENLNLMNELVKYDPTNAEELGATGLHRPLQHYKDLSEDYQGKDRSLNFFADWWLLSNCDIILMPPSTFSFTAAMMGRNVKDTWLATAGFGDFRKIDVWNADPLPAEWCEDFRHVPGICLDHNPPHYWRCPDCKGLQKTASGEKCVRCTGWGTLPEAPEEWKTKWKGIKC